MVSVERAVVGTVGAAPAFCAVMSRSLRSRRQKLDRHGHGGHRVVARKAEAVADEDRSSSRTVAAIDLADD